MIIEMKLTHEPYRMIVRGEKTVEIRLNDEKRKKIQVGDVIRFIYIEDMMQYVEAKVIALHHYPTFMALLSSDLYHKCGCDGYTIETAVESMYQYYTKEQELQYGVLGIEIKRIEAI